MLNCFKRKSKRCTNISLNYNPRKLDEGIDLCLGVDMGNECPNTPDRGVAYFHLGSYKDLDWLIEYLQKTRNDCTIFDS